MASLIEQAKQVPAGTIAQQQGLILKQMGERYWACCPFHAERHASMCFYPDGSWYCFSCKAGGDSIDLLSRLKNISMKDAAEEICGKAAHSGTPAQAAHKVFRKPGHWASWKMKQLKKTINMADEYTGQYTAETADQAWDDPIFIAAIRAKGQASCEIDELLSADGIEMEWLMMQEGGRRSE